MLDGTNLHTSAQELEEAKRANASASAPYAVAALPKAALSSEDSEYRLLLLAVANFLRDFEEPLDLRPLPLPAIVAAIEGHDVESEQILSGLFLALIKVCARHLASRSASIKQLIASVLRCM